MNDTNDEPAPGRSNRLLEQERLEWLHERSGEVELLISAALLFGLLQLPGRLELWWDAIGPTLSRESGALGFLLYFYGRVMAITLIGAFALHLVARAYWVGLVGLDSVFPEGIDWDRVNYGPMAKEVYRERLPTLPQLIRKADNFGSMIFSVAFLIIIMFVFSIVFGMVFGALGWGLHVTVLPGVSPTTILVAAALVVGLVPAITIGLERALGERLDRSSGTARTMRTIIAAYVRSAGGVLYLPIQFTLFSRIPKRVVWPAAIAMTLGLMATLMVTELSRSSGLRVAVDTRMPDRPGRRTVSSDAFADTRAAHSTDPYIQSDIVEGPYVRLMIPLYGAAYQDRLTSVCPGLPPLGRGGLVTTDPSEDVPDRAREAELLDCLGGIWSVSLDGRILEPSWDMVWTRRGPEAIVAYLPTADLAPGAHLLEITRIPRPSDDGDPVQGDPGQGDPAPGDDGTGSATAGGVDGDDENRPALYFIRFRT